MFRDPSSSANIDEATVNHISLCWRVDFSKRLLQGTAKLFVEIVKATDKIILDGRFLNIVSVKLNGELVDVQVTDVGMLGQNILVTVGKRNRGEKITLEFAYNTGENCTALQFMDTQQTAAKLKPFLFSQCQAIHARSIMPCMDTPSVKQTYDAKVAISDGLVCLMSAIYLGMIETPAKEALHSFQQTIRIPSYLFAIVVGLLEKRDISSRSAIWAEPPVVDSAFFEFDETEKMLATAENLAGKYIWGRYDLVVLPPSFPFGGMENPCLTFITPTLLAGDRSLASVIAHEIAHSWTGNLVTNVNWEHFWLNEGFTTFLERKIIGRLKGERERHFEAQCGWEDHLLSAVKEQFSEDHPFTKLIPDLKNLDPDDAFSSVPYEKGSALLMYIEQQIGDTKAFEEFLRKYIAKFAQKSITTSDWKKFLFDSFPEKKAVLDGINWNEWLNMPGIPKVKPKYDNTLMFEACDLAQKWADISETNLASINAVKYGTLSMRQRIKVLEYLRLHVKVPLSHNKLERLDAVNSFSTSCNCEILSSWIRLCLKSYWSKIIPTALHFVSRQGRLKYVKPIYRELFNWTESAGRSIVTFGNNAPFMHPITVSVIGKMIPK